jgi:hypothetical protein
VSATVELLNTLVLMHNQIKNNWLILIAIIYSILPTIAFGMPLATAPKASQQSADQRTFDIAADPDFSNYRQVMTRFAKEHRPDAANNFCIVGSTTDDTKSAWVLWREGAQIILWEGGDDLDQSRRIIHLKSDVVRTEGDLHGSTYLVTKAWVKELFQSCDRVGTKVHIRK